MIVEARLYPELLAADGAVHRTGEAAVDAVIVLVPGLPGLDRGRRGEFLPLSNVVASPAGAGWSPHGLVVVCVRLAPHLLLARLVSAGQALAGQRGRHLTGSGEGRGAASHLLQFVPAGKCEHQVLRLI